jgi:hypothetical protein
VLVCGVIVEILTHLPFDLSLKTTVVLNLNVTSSLICRQLRLIEFVEREKVMIKSKSKSPSDVHSVIVKHNYPRTIAIFISIFPLVAVFNERKEEEDVRMKVKS